MAFKKSDLKEYDFIRKVRKGTEEITISLSYKFVKAYNIEIGDRIDLRNLKVKKKVIENN